MIYIVLVIKSSVLRVQEKGDLDKGEEGQMFLPSPSFLNEALIAAVLCFVRALGRIGSVHMKQEEYALAVKFFDKSLTEFRNQDIIKKKKEVRMEVIYY